MKPLPDWSASAQGLRIDASLSEPGSVYRPGASGSACCGRWYHGNEQGGKVYAQRATGTLMRTEYAHYSQGKAEN